MQVEYTCYSIKPTQCLTVWINNILNNRNTWFMIGPLRLIASEELFWVISFILVKFLKFKRGITPRKKMNQNFLWICTSTHYVLYNYKDSGNSVERFQRSCADEIGLTDRRVKNIIPSATHCVGYNYNAPVIDQDRILYK